MLTDAGVHQASDDVVVKDVVMGTPSASSRDVLDEGASVTVLEDVEDVVDGTEEVEVARRSDDDGVGAEAEDDDVDVEVDEAEDGPKFLTG